MGSVEVREQAEEASDVTEPVTDLVSDRRAGLAKPKEDDVDHSPKEESRAQKRGDVCIVLLPTSLQQVLELEMQSQVPMEKPLLFEPHDRGRLCGLDAPEAVMEARSW